MDYKASFKIEPAGKREIVMTRIFNATSDLVFDALTKPELVKRWLLGPPGWSMPVCEIDLKVEENIVMSGETRTGAKWAWKERIARLSGPIRSLTPKDLMKPEYPGKP